MVHVRLSDSELAMIDAARGALTRSDYVRSLIAGPGDTAEHVHTQDRAVDRLSGLWRCQCGFLFVA